MALNSINTNVAAMAAQSNIGKASTMSGSSIARLSSGNRITRASDDVAAMSAGTSLRTNVTTLKMALINTSQGSSLLQVADGALSQVTDILQRQKSIAVQSGSGSLTSAERSFLNQEFQSLTEEIDRLSTQTNFNGVNLLDGSVFDKTDVGTEKTAATAGTITFNAPAVADGNTIIVNDNGVQRTLELDDSTTVGTLANAANVRISYDGSASTTPAQRLQQIANSINQVGNLGFTASTNGTNMVFTAIGGGDASAGITYDNASTFGAGAGRNYTTNAGAAFGTAVTGFVAGADNGIGRGSVKAVGTIGDTVIAPQKQTAVSETINFANAVFADNQNFTFSDGAGGTVTFQTRDASQAAPTALAANTVGIEVREYVEAVANGGDVEAARKIVVDRFVEAINDYSTIATQTGYVGNEGATSGQSNTASATADYFFSQVTAKRDGNDLVITANEAGALRRGDDATALTAMTVAGGATLVGAGTFDIPAGQLNGGINVDGINNEAFTGTIKGFDVTFRGTNNVDIKVEVGDRTYSASNVNLNQNYGLNTSTSPATAATSSLRLTSDEGDGFTIDLQGLSQSLNVTNQAGAKSLSTRLDKAFESINFVQDRNIESFAAAGDIFAGGAQIGSLNGSSFSLQTDDFSDVAIQDIKVKGPVSGSSKATMQVTINDEIYRLDTNFGTQLGASGQIQLVNENDGNKVLTFNNGGAALTIVNDSQAKAVETALKDAFGIGKGGEKLNFQVGVTTVDTLEISLGSVTSEKIFAGEKLDVLTKESAAAAADAIDKAIDAVTSVRADVGALQSRFNFAAANVESSISNQDSARGILLDTDVAAESTAFATAQVQLQAGISVLAQANQLQQNLLKLIG